MVSRNPDPLKDELEAIEFEGSTQTLTVLRSEADKTVERQLATLADIDDKASWMLRLDVLLVGVVVSALSIVSQLEGKSDAGVSVIDSSRTSTSSWPSPRSSSRRRSPQSRIRQPSTTSG